MGKRFLLRRSGFTLVELLVVIGIIGVLIALLLPALSKAQQQANWVSCQSNMRQVGIYLQTYINDWKGWIFPPDLGANRPRDQRWPVHVFRPPQWNPKVLLCRSDFEPAEEHSYILNDHLVIHKIRAHSKIPNRTSSEMIVMGEKKTQRDDYYMNENDYPSRIEFYRHGLRLGSNYLFLDWHVGLLPEKLGLQGINPWDVPAPDPPPEP